MTEKQIGFLFNIASILSQENSNHSQRLLESYYLMRCKDITKGHGLPMKYFSSLVRCSQCCLEWKSGTKVSIKQTKLSKRQKKRIKLQIKEIKTKGKKCSTKKENPLLCNKIEQICSFCKNSTGIPMLKAQNKQDNSLETKEISLNNNKNTHVPFTSKVQPAKSVTNVYSTSKDIFSLKNEKNILNSVTKDTPKVIKNNKKKRDKFAGLCQKAVLASAKLKAEKNSQKDKLSLFLRPSL